MSVVRVGGELLAVSRRLNDAPFAVTSDGNVLLNVTHLRMVKRPEDALALAKHSSGDMFVGVVMTGSEVRAALEQLGHGCREAAAYTAGKRLKRARK